MRFADPRRIACRPVGIRRVPAQPDASDPATLARAVQARYDRVRDFTADFTHTYTGGVLKKQVVERGTIQVKKPGRMRWRYQSGREAVRVRRASDLFICAGGSPGHRQSDAGRGPGDDRGAVSDRQGKPGAGLHGETGPRAPGRRPARWRSS